MRNWTDPCRLAQLWLKVDTRDGDASRCTASQVFAMVHQSFATRVWESGCFAGGREPQYKITSELRHQTRGLERVFSMAQQLFFALRREVDDLIQLQIQALKQQALLSPFQLHDCHARFERIMDLQEEVARLRKEHILGGTKLIGLSGRRAIIADD